MKTRLLTLAICIIAVFSVDLAYGYHPVSPYAYALNNPVRYVDPNGMDVWEFDDAGNIINRIEDKTQDAFHMVQQVDGAWQRVGDGRTFEYRTVISQNTYTFSPDGKTVSSYDVFKVRGDDNATSIFEFMANNITGSPTQVEVGQVMTGIAGDQGLNFITNGHMRNTEPGIALFMGGQGINGYTVREINHSHPNIPGSHLPSGLNDRTSGDIGFASQVTNVMTTRGYNVPTFHIYDVRTQNKIPFGPLSQRADFNRYR